MKTFRCPLRILTFLLCAVLLVSCVKDTHSDADTSEAVTESAAAETTDKTNETKDGGTENKAYKTLKLKDIKDNVKIYGRTRMLSTGLTCDWSASGIEFSAECKGSIMVNITSTANAYFAVFVNGERKENISLNAGKNYVCLASGLDGGVHSFKLLKMSHTGHANTVIESIVLDGKLKERPEDRELLIEFIGDSITCGTCVLANSSTENSNTYKFCDATKAYAYMTAERLGADWNVVGMSGSGIIKGWGDTNIATQNYFKDSFTRDTREYDFSAARTPDVIVINLGTNDCTIGVDASEINELKETVKRFVTDIRQKYGKDIPIVWAHGMMNEGMISHIKAALADLGGEESGYYTVELTNNRMGGSGHPNVQGMAKAADELCAYIKDSVLKNNAK